MAANRLLILDDDPGVLQYLGDVGRQCHYEVTFAGSWGELRETYAASDPSMLILDLRYGHGDAVEVLSFLQRHGCRAPIVLISGLDTRALETTRRIGLNQGLAIVGAIEKPILYEMLAPLLLAHRQPELAEWADELRRGVDRGDITVFYQPKLSVADGRLVGFEALARWFHPTRGEIGPDTFIPLAEATGLIAPITDLVLDHAVATCACWAAAGHDLSVAVNLSATVLTRDGLVESLLRLLARHRLPVASLTLEITESIAIRNAVLAMEALSRLRMRGFTVALDDFGTGYSNLAALDRLPVNELKIDKGIIAAASTSRTSQIIVRAIADLARQLGLITVAEGVDRLEACHWLGSVGIEQVQGFAIARPMPSSELLSWIGSRPSRSPFAPPASY